jgi:hypothetical protein
MDSKTFSHQYSEALVEAAFAKLGYFVYTNKSGKATCDLVVEDSEGYLLRVEVKSSHTVKENHTGKYIEVQLKSVRSNTTENTVKTFKNSSVDLLALVCTETSQLTILNSCNITNTSSIRVYLETMHTLQDIVIK